MVLSFLERVKLMFCRSSVLHSPISSCIILCRANRDVCLSNYWTDHGMILRETKKIARKIHKFCFSDMFWHLLHSYNLLQYTTIYYNFPNSDNLRQPTTTYDTYSDNFFYFPYFQLHKVAIFITASDNNRLILTNYDNYTEYYVTNTVMYCILMIALTDHTCVCTLRGRCKLCFGKSLY